MADDPRYCSSCGGYTGGYGGHLCPSLRGTIAAAPARRVALLAVEAREISYDGERWGYVMHGGRGRWTVFRCDELLDECHFALEFGDVGGALGDVRDVVEAEGVHV